MIDWSYRFRRLCRPKKIKLGNQKERLTDLEKLWYYDPYFVDHALHSDTGKPWKIHKKRINPLVFNPVPDIVKRTKLYWVKALSGFFILSSAVFLNY